MTLPPGQRALEGFPRFGTHMHHSPPTVSPEPTIEIAGAVRRPFALSTRDLASLPRREITADFHCVAGWSATGLRWSGVAFTAVYHELIEPSLQSGDPVSHLVFEGLDGYTWTAMLEDACADDVLIADCLNGAPLEPEHGAPMRLVSPNQYGYVNVKHLARIALLTSHPRETYGAAWWVEAGLRSPLIRPHPRARVWREERNRFIPGLLLRPFYRLLIPPIALLSKRGIEDGQDPERG